MTEQSSYYAIIPAAIRYDEELIQGAKLLYGEISALCHQKGYCWASDSYFAKLYKVSKKTIQSWLRSLENKTYIVREVIYKEGTKEIVTRYIRLGAHPVNQKVSRPIDKKVRDNNTSFNKTINKTKSFSCPDEANQIPYEEIMAYFNLKTDSNLVMTKRSQMLILARWREGFSLADFKQVIDNKCFDWQVPGKTFSNGKLTATYLRPTTLFGEKFEDYLLERNQENQVKKEYGWE